MERNARLILSKPVETKAGQKEAGRKGRLRMVRSAHSEHTNEHVETTSGAAFQ